MTVYNKHTYMKELKYSYQPPHQWSLRHNQFTYCWPCFYAYSILSNFHPWLLYCTSVVCLSITQFWL